MPQQSSSSEASRGHSNEVHLLLAKASPAVEVDSLWELLSWLLTGMCVHVSMYVYMPTCTYLHHKVRRYGVGQDTRHDLSRTARTPGREQASIPACTRLDVRPNGAPGNVRGEKGNASPYS